jgi:fumarate reductase subunit C
MSKLILAVIVQIIVFGIYFYVDARQTTAPDWASVIKFGLNPLILAYFAFSVFPIWWSYRTLYQFYEQRFWAAAMLQGFIIQVTYVLASYLGSRQTPNLREGIAIGLVFLSVLVAGQR